MKIQQLKESILTEAFSPSMPDWLKKRLQLELTISDYGTDSRTRRKHPKRDYKADRVKLTGNNSMWKISPAGGRTYSGYNLWDEMMNANININDGKFIEGDVPTNARDPRLKSPNVAFLLLGDPSDMNNSEVYSPQLNMNRDSTVLPQGGPLKYQSMKQLLPHTAAFCYIDMSDPNNMLDTKKKISDRTDLEQSFDQRFVRGNSKFNPLTKLWDLGDDPRYQPSYSNDDPSWAKLDKSGFSKIPNGRRYAQELKKHGDKKLARKIEAFYNDLQTLFSQLPTVFSNLELKDYDWDIRNNFQNGLGALYSAKNEYTAATEYLDSFKQRPDRTWYLESAQENLENGKNYLDQVKRIFGDYLPAVVDWDTDDVEWVD